MRRLNKGNRTGLRFFIIHLCVEIVCFANISRFFPVEITGLIAILYDFLAFVPQGLFGGFMEKHRRFPMKTIAVGLMAAGVFVSSFSPVPAIISGICIMALGNAILHEQGAIETVADGAGKIFPAALFVAGGSFGVVIGKTMGQFELSLLWLIIPLAVIEILLILPGEISENKPYPQYNCVRYKNIDVSSPDFPIGLIIIAAFCVTAVRSFIGYAIPISWKKELWQDFLLFFVMGIGKGLGGFLADRFGARRVGVFSTILAIPFLIVGANNMVISVLGVCLFSMTMCITFEMILSVLPQNPGIAFGVTTFALFAGYAPVFFVSLTTKTNIILVTVLSAICALLLFLTCNNRVDLTGRNNIQRSESDGQNY